MVIGGRDNDASIVSVFHKLVARIHCSEVFRSYYVYAAGPTAEPWVMLAVIFLTVEVQDKV